MDIAAALEFYRYAEESSVALVGVAMIVTPSFASAGPTAPTNLASSLSVAPSVRVGAATTNFSKITRQGTIIAGILALGIVSGGILLIADDDDDNSSSR